MKKVTPKDIKREWRLVDASNKILGRVSSQVALYLMGKNKRYYVPHLDTGDYVVVINAKKIRLSGKKENQKKYFRHSGFPGGLYFKTAAQSRLQKPEFLIRHAVRGMLPKTTLGRQMLKKLFVYAEENHPHGDKFVRDKDTGQKAITESTEDEKKAQRKQPSVPSKLLEPSVVAIK